MAQPEKVFKSGKVRVAVFRNTPQDNAPFRSIDISIAYYKDNKWNYGKGMTASDAIIARHLMEQAINYMLEEDQIDADAHYRESGSRRKDRYEEERPIYDDSPF